MKSALTSSLRMLAVVLTLGVVGVNCARASPTSVPRVDFNREIRPILGGNCLKCHGPDEASRKGQLRLDLGEEATKPAKSGVPAILAGSPEKSELIRRINSPNPALRMPPPESGKTLTAAQIGTLQQWIAEGASYARHWAYVQPVKPPPPLVKTSGWTRNGLDFFVLARLEREDLKPSPEADRTTIIRRLHLDLVGLPPTPEQVQAFVSDTAPDAFERAVDGLLARPAFGEHWGRLWLDLARYADSAGYADDPPRTAWSYRDYVIRAFNLDKPFDRFTLEQIAGDLLPEAGDEERTATGFHRNTMTNNEGGTEDEEFRVAAVVDRVNTTMAVWMATSMACAQCHTHKYDPISQHEYFSMFAIFNQTADADRPDESPVLQVFSATEKAKRMDLSKTLETIENRFRSDAFLTARARWELTFPLELAWTETPASSQQPVSEKAAYFQQMGPTSALLHGILLAPAQRDDQTREEVDTFYTSMVPELAAERMRLSELRKALTDLPHTTVPIMQELPPEKHRVTQVHLRGNFRTPGDVVSPGVPAVFPPLPTDGPPDRLALARWLVDARNPLTARVLANRLWEQIFGQGLVRLSEEFGSQGEQPSHPELLDYLAVQLMEDQWSMKRLLRLLVTSATYRQTSRVTPELRERDPDNVLLARGPRFRMSAEMVRDQALFVSGLLSSKMYGPPVRPPQPSLGLSAAFGGGLDWKTSEGEDRYRRAIYTEWRRTSPYASMATFDAPSREVCTLKRPRANTPLQALVTLNDPVFFEAAQSLARRLWTLRGTAEERIRHGFRLCLARNPKPAEIASLCDLLEAAKQDFDQHPERAQKAATDPLGPLPTGAPPAELASLTTVANVLLNLDEFLMRP